MSLSLRALASTALLTGALCMTATGTAQAISGSFTCPYTSYNPATGSVTTTLCQGGPASATSGTITNTGTGARYQCDYLHATAVGSFFYMLTASQCTPF
jgi:hypothetical protein